MAYGSHRMRLERGMHMTHCEHSYRSELVRQSFMFERERLATNTIAAFQNYNIEMNTKFQIINHMTITA